MQEEEIGKLKDSLDEILNHPSPELTDVFNILCPAELNSRMLIDWGKEIGKRCDALKLKMAALMEEQGLQSFKDDRGRMAIVSPPRVYASIRAEQKEAALNLLKNEWGADYAVQPGIAPATLSRIIKERLEQGLNIPEDMFSYYIKKGISIRGNKMTTVAS